MQQNNHLDATFSNILSSFSFLKLDMVERLPEGAEVVASGALSTAPSSPGNVEASTSQAWINEASTSDAFIGNASNSEPTNQASSPASTANQGSTRKRQQQASPVDKVLQLLERQENRAETLAKKEYKLSKKTVRLHEEANAIQREMVGIIREYFAGRQENQPDPSLDLE